MAPPTAPSIGRRDLTGGAAAPCCRQDKLPDSSRAGQARKAAGLCF